MVKQIETAAEGDFYLRIVASAEKEREGEEIRITEDHVIIGRDKDCAIVLNDPKVSRRHAKLETTATGFRVIDLGSSNGVWIGQKRTKEELLTPSTMFRIGSTIFECMARPTEVPAEAGEAPDLDKTVLVGQEAKPLAETQPEPGPGEGFIVRIVSAGDEEKVGEEFQVAADTAILGRADDCTVILDDKDISRRHAKIEAVPQGFRLTDLGSSNGTWIDERRVKGAEVVKPGQSFRLGEKTILECRSTAAEAGPVEDEALPDMTVAIPSTVELVAKTKPLENEGEAVEVSAHRPFLLDDAASAWYVVSGGVDIFTVAVKEGEAVGTRSHFLEILAGQCFMGFDLKSYGMGSGFLAVGKQGTQLRKIPLRRLKEMATDPRSARAIATLIDTWVEGLSKSLVRDIKSERGDVALKRGETVELGKQNKASAAEGVVWLDIWSGSVIVNNMATPVFAGKRVLFPVTPDSWIQPVSDEFGTLSLAPLSTLGAAGNPALWQGLEVFQHVLCECEFINKKLAAVDEFVRLQQKAEHAEAAKEAAYDAIGSVLSSEAARPKGFLDTGAAEPVFQACELVGKAMGIQVKAHPDADEKHTYEENVAAIARASGFRTRVVALRGQWWAEDHGPLLGQLEDGTAPVAILPSSARSYDIIDPKTFRRTQVTEEVSESLAAFAYAFYRPFPDGPLHVMDVVRSGARGLFTDFRLLVFMGVTVGLLGTLTPYFTGRIFDSAIPQAERGMLLGFGIALFGAALATSLFKLVQGVATVRIQGRMEYSIQAALWDRLLNLPANFFRTYSAGDLSERAAGVDAIQSLVSGAGVSAILGSFSGIFYVFLMFTYNMRLTLLAIFLTLLFVGVTTGANYLQLRYQRVEIKLRGRITGLVLNLITGVTKLRICGAEPHAFRVWAQEFAQQKKIAFSIGRIQNTVQVFNGFFPVLSSMAIFIVMVNAQKEAAQTGQTVLTTGEFIAFNSAYGLFLTAMQALGDASLNMLRVVPIYERLKPIITTPAEVDATKVFPGKLKGEIELSHIHFRYHDDGPWIIKDLSLHIDPSDFVAFVGGSGCGKSTLMRLMLGFEQPVTGTLYYDGQDLGGLDLRMLRQQLGVVLQVSKVLPTEIYRNIIGISSRSIEEAWEAAEMAGLAEDIRQMPMGMHTYVSEGGGTLSGGQRQRLLIARAVVNKPKIIFLDEATSALDNRAQATVTESMDRMDASRIVIAHRLSTVINANKICYLEGGQIAEMGTYDELMAKDGLFAKLAKRQMA